MLYKNKYKIESTRLPSYDYSSAGAYFITICTKNREYYFGEIINGIMRLTEIGRIAVEYWTAMPKIFDNLIIDEFVVMPNHVHLTLFIYNVETRLGAINVETRRGNNVETRRGASLRDIKNQIPLYNEYYQPPKNPQFNKFGPLIKNSVSSIINHYKGQVTKYAKGNNIAFGWQERFYDRIIRNDEELFNTQNYIIGNPGKWEGDRNNLENLYM